MVVISLEWGLQNKKHQLIILCIFFKYYWQISCSWVGTITFKFLIPYPHKQMIPSHLRNPDLIIENDVILMVCFSKESFMVTIQTYRFFRTADNGLQIKYS